MIQENKIAEYFNVVPELVPFIPELLTDLWELGSSPELILQWIHDFDLPPDLIRVLDMGCGKGAVSISLAKKFDFQVKGIDFFEPFLKEAEKKAKEFNVSTLCQFCLADIREAVLSETEYNMVIYTAIGSVLGSLDQSIGKLRLTVNEGGLIIIDD
ncbi:MAG: class I SAM-dependent methyltransferase, partial [Candidatus Aminicenantes bacterium]|nr:class I SAM-dependent methyltransferase [Candidatus Aminicenantes bacterium]